MKNNNLFLAVLSVIAVVLVGAMAYTYTARNTDPNIVPIVDDNEGDNNVEPPDELAGTATDTDAASNWQTYRNQDYGFELEYPPSFKFCDNLYRGPERYEIVRLTGVDQECSVSEYDEMTDVISVYEELAIEKEYFNLDSLEKQLREQEGFEVGGRTMFEVGLVQRTKTPRFEFLTVSQGSPAGYPGAVGNYIFQNGKLFNLQFGLNGDYEKNKVLIDQMLSTFKFSEINKCAVLGERAYGEKGGAGVGFDCKYNIGSGVEGWRFSCPEPRESNIEVDIYDQDDQFIQKITVADDVPHLYSGLNLADDINFDGYKDLRILNTQGAYVVSFDYWIFDPVLKKFQKDPVLANIPFAEFNKDKRIIIGQLYSNLSGTHETIFNFKNGKYEIGESQTIPINK